jgi:hypothetical protein
MSLSIGREDREKGRDRGERRRLCTSFRFWLAPGEDFADEGGRIGPGIDVSEHETGPRREGEGLDGVCPFRVWWKKRGKERMGWLGKKAKKKEGRGKGD